MLKTINVVQLQPTSVSAKVVSFVRSSWRASTVGARQATTSGEQCVLGEVNDSCNMVGNEKGIGEALFLESLKSARANGARPGRIGCPLESVNLSSR